METHHWATKEGNRQERQEGHREACFPLMLSWATSGVPDLPVLQSRLQQHKRPLFGNMHLQEQARRLPAVCCTLQTSA